MNESNLKPLNKRTPEERLAIQSKGGKASQRAKKERKLFKEEIAKRLGAKDYEEIIDNLIARAKEYDKSFEVLRDTLGETITKEVAVDTGNNITITITGEDAD